MCMFNSPDIPSPTEIPERQAARAPDAGAARSSAGRRTLDRTRAGASTILTSGSGLTDTAATSGATLLGQ